MSATHVRLSDALRATGFRLVRRRRPATHPDRLGKQQAHDKAVLLTNRRVAVVGDSWRWAYEASHEIAEFMHNFKHSEMLFISQANILAMWHRLRSGEKKVPFLLVKSGAAED